MPSMLACPECGKYQFHKSHTKNSYERFRKFFFRQRPYRCHSCGYRGWVSQSVLKPKKTLKDWLIYVVVLIVAILVSLFLKNFLL